MWRRFQIAGDSTVARFAYAVQTMYEMTEGHQREIHCYERSVSASGRPGKKAELVARFGFVGDDRDEDATIVRLDQLGLGSSRFLVVRYDFGDNWQVKAVLEKVLEDSGLGKNDLPCVLSGKGRGIIEDSGGPRRLMALVEAAKTKKGAVYHDYREWIHEMADWDLDSFNVDQMNAKLRRM